MQKIAKFEKVSKEQFIPAFMETFGKTEEEALKAYDNLKLPVRATVGSAGYDIFTPADFTLQPGETVKIPTGIRVQIENGWFLGIFPRSGLGFKYRLQLDNTVGIIDSDYYFSKNEGHIFVKITNDGKGDKVLSLEAGAGFSQGIFLPFGITVDDDCEGIRDGGFGSTGA